MPNCREIFLRHLSPASLVGIEFGALNNPVIRKEEGQVYYIDYTDTAGLRRDWSSTPPAGIEEVDFVWRGGALLPIVGHTVDYAIANHVLEHIPDLLTWLLEIHTVLKTGGHLCLTIPDKRFTFDIRRPVSTLGEMLENQFNRLTRPPLRAILDQSAFGEVVDKVAAWAAGPRNCGTFSNSEQALTHALSYIERWGQSNIYIDAHVSVFTPMSFLEIIEALSLLRRFPYIVALFLSTEENEYDFHVHLAAAADPGDPRIAQSIAFAKNMVQTSPSELLYYGRRTAAAAE